MGSATLTVGIWPGRDVSILMFDKIRIPVKVMLNYSVRIKFISGVSGVSTDAQINLCQTPVGCETKIKMNGLKRWPHQLGT